MNSQNHIRNRSGDGHSFYFFDFDDNLVFLPTPTILFCKRSGKSLLVEWSDFLREQKKIGQEGIYKDHEIRWEDHAGSFQYFRDHSAEDLSKIGRKRQIILEDIESVLGQPHVNWKGPSWSYLQHAAQNERPVSLITARGHAPETLAAALDLFVGAGHLPKTPRYLTLLPVHHAATKEKLARGEPNLRTPELKRRAIRYSVEEAFRKYGPSPHHRFGMSDDDPANIEMIVEEMKVLKKDYPENGFFMIQTTHGLARMFEVNRTGVVETKMSVKDAERFLLPQI